MAITISMEEDLKRDFTEVCREMGLPDGVRALSSSPPASLPFFVRMASGTSLGSGHVGEAVSEGHPATCMRLGDHMFGIGGHPRRE